jgi:hypothetical protein
VYRRYLGTEPPRADCVEHAVRSVVDSIAWDPPAEGFDAGRLPPSTLPAVRAFYTGLAGVSDAGSSGWGSSGERWLELCSGLPAETGVVYLRRSAGGDDHVSSDFSPSATTTSAHSSGSSSGGGGGRQQSWLLSESDPAAVDASTPVNDYELSPTATNVLATTIALLGGMGLSPSGSSGWRWNDPAVLEACEVMGLGRHHLSPWHYSGCQQYCGSAIFWKDWHLPYDWQVLLVLIVITLRFDRSR